MSKSPFIIKDPSKQSYLNIAIASSVGAMEQLNAGHKNILTLQEQGVSVPLQCHVSSKTFAKGFSLNTWFWHLCECQGQFANLE